MTATRPHRVTIAARTLALALALAGCAGQQGSGGKAPGVTFEEEPEAATTQPKTVQGGAAKPAAKARPGARDRDPEVERRKMAASLQQSAVAEKSLRAGDLDGAVNQAREALMTHEQNAEAMLVMGEVFYRRENYELVLAVTASVLQIDPKVIRPSDASRAHNLKGFAYLATGRQEAAFQSFRKAAEADANNAAAWNNLGAQYLRIGDTKVAIECFDYATKLDPKFFKAHLNLGSALRASRDWAKAEAAYREALKLRASYPEAYFNLGVLYLDADPYPGLDTSARLQKAIDNFTRYRELASAAGIGEGERIGDDIARAGKPKTTKGKKKKAAAEPVKAVSIAQADLYVEIAKKGIDRERKRQEKGQKRKQAEAEAEANAAKAAAAEPAAAEPAVKPGKAGAGPTTPEPAEPSKPAQPQKPGGSSPAQPQKPGGSAPAQPQKPGGGAPTQKPGAPPVQTAKPSVQKPGGG
ncbi:MAG: tetratricopeptide repeat protein [Myxococcales bacterium]|nr:tetratricopeptide repeat protein [Myxococcales bacterium]